MSIALKGFSVCNPGGTVSLESPTCMTYGRDHVRRTTSCLQKCFWTRYLSVYFGYHKSSGSRWTHINFVSGQVVRLCPLALPSFILSSNVLACSLGPGFFGIAPKYHTSLVPIFWLSKRWGNTWAPENGKNHRVGGCWVAQWIGNRGAMRVQYEAIPPLTQNCRFA